MVIYFIEHFVSSLVCPIAPEYLLLSDTYSVLESNGSLIIEVRRTMPVDDTATLGKLTDTNLWHNYVLINDSNSSTIQTSKHPSDVPHKPFLQVVTPKCYTQHRTMPPLTLTHTPTTPPHTHTVLHKIS